MQEKSENFNSLRPILLELCKKNYRGGGQIDPPPAGIGLRVEIGECGTCHYFKNDLFFQDLLITLGNSTLFIYYECCILFTYSFTVLKAMSPPLSICLLLHVNLVIVGTQTHFFIFTEYIRCDSHTIFGIVKLSQVLGDCSA